MARIPDCRRKKYQRLSASAVMEAPMISEDKRIQKNGDLANGILGATGNSDEMKVLGKDVGDHDTEPQQDEVGVRKECTQLVLRRLKQTEKHRKKVPAKRKWLSAHLQTNSLDTEKDVASLQQLHKLKATVERLGGKLDNGWHVTSQRRPNNGLPIFSFISPTKERFRSRIEVVRYLGLPARPAKSRYILGAHRLLPNSQRALVPLDRQKRAVTKSSKALDIKDCEGLEHAGKVVSHASNYANDPQMTSTPSLSASVVTERCQDILRSLISTESFATASNLVSQFAPSLSMDATSQLKGPSFLASSLDLNLIHLRLSTGAYGQSPELFSTDIQQVWKNIISAGNELVVLASSLAELSESLYKQQILSLFDGTPKNTVHASNTRIQQFVHDNRVHLPLPNRIIARGSDGTLLRELLTTKTSCQLDNKLHKTIGKAEELFTSQGGLSCTSTGSVCRNCRLTQGAECIVCKHCKASYHQKCVTSISAAGGWCCPLCFLNQDTKNAGEWGTFNKGILDEETQKELLLISSNATTDMCQGIEISTGKAEICEACKKEDDNVLLCDACDAAYHMNCLSPPIENVPDGFWYCPACDEAGKRVMVLQQDTEVHNCAVCERVSRELLNCAENESTARVFSKDTSPVYLAPECTMDQEYPDGNLDQGVPELCIENKAMDPDFFAGTGNVCKFCRLDEGKKAVSCSNCQNCYHLSCLRPALRKRPSKTWFCPSCLCRMCKIDVDDDKILLCDVCDEGYHTYCLTPPVSEIPEAPWFCSTCIPSNTDEPKKKRKSNELRRSM